MKLQDASKLLLVLSLFQVTWANSEDHDKGKTGNGRTGENQQQDEEKDELSKVEEPVGVSTRGVDYTG